MSCFIALYRCISVIISRVFTIGTRVIRDLEALNHEFNFKLKLTFCESEIANEEKHNLRHKT